MMKRYLPIALVAMLVLALAVPTTASPFSDVPENHWAYEAVKQLAAYGVIEGFPDGTFKGSEPTTRYQMAMVIARLLVSLDAQIKAEMDAAKTQITPAVVPAPAVVEKVVEKETVTVEKPVIEKVIETTIVEKLKTEELDALAARVASAEIAIDGVSGKIDAVDQKADEINTKVIELDGALALLEGELSVKALELETKTAAGDADLEDKVAALHDEIEAKLADTNSTLNAKIDAKAKELVALIDALKAEFHLELTALGVRVVALEEQLALVNSKVDDLEAKLAASHEDLAGRIAALKDELEVKLAAVDADLQTRIAVGDIEGANKLAATKAELEAKIAALDEKASATDARLAAHIDGHEKVSISGTSEVVLKDVDIYAPSASFNPAHAWINPNDIYDSVPHSDGAYVPTTTFEHKLNLTLTARPANGVVLGINIGTIKKIYGAADEPDFAISDMSLDITTPGVLARLYSGDIVLPEGTFTPYTLHAGELLDPDDEPLYEGVMGQLGYGKFSGTTMFLRVQPAIIIEGEGEEEDTIEQYAAYACAGEGKVALTDNLKLSAAYVSWFDDPQSVVIDEEEPGTGFVPMPQKDTVVGIAASYELAPGWSASGEFAKDTKYLDGVSVETGTAMKIDVAGKVGLVELAGNYTRVEDTFAPHFVLIDPDDGIENDVKSVSIDGKLPLGALTLKAGYKVTGDADVLGDWDDRKTTTATAGASYNMAWGAMTVTPSVDLENNVYVLGSSVYDDGDSVLKLTGGVKAVLAPITAEYKVTGAKIKGTGDPYEAYYAKSVFDLGLNYAMTPNLSITGGYNWTKLDDNIDTFIADDGDPYYIKDTNTSVFKAGLAAEFPLTEATKITGSYNYEGKTDMLNSYKPYTKSILKTGITSQLTPKASVAASAEFDRLDKWTNASDEYEFAPLSNLIASVNYTYNITTNTTLGLGYKVVKSDRTRDELDIDYDYTARIITGSLKVSF